MQLCSCGGVCGQWVWRWRQRRRLADAPTAVSERAVFDHRPAGRYRRRGDDGRAVAVNYTRLALQRDRRRQQRHALTVASTPVARSRSWLARTKSSRASVRASQGMRVGGIAPGGCSAEPRLWNNPPRTAPHSARTKRWSSRSTCSRSNSYFRELAERDEQVQSRLAQPVFDLHHHQLLIARRALRVDHLDVRGRPRVEGNDRDLQHLARGRDGLARAGERALAGRHRRPRVAHLGARFDLQLLQRQRRGLENRLALRGAAPRRWPPSNSGCDSCSDSAHVRDGWNNPDGVISCGPKFTDAAGHQSLRLSLTMRSLAARSAVNTRTSGRFGSHSVSGISTGPRTTARRSRPPDRSRRGARPSASCARAHVQPQHLEQACVAARICADRNSFRRLPTPPSRRRVLKSNWPRAVSMRRQAHLDLPLLRDDRQIRGRRGHRDLTARVGHRQPRDLDLVHRLHPRRPLRGGERHRRRQAEQRLVLRLHRLLAERAAAVERGVGDAGAHARQRPGARLLQQRLGAQDIRRRDRNGRILLQRASNRFVKRNGFDRLLRKRRRSEPTAPLRTMMPVTRPACTGCTVCTMCTLCTVRRRRDRDAPVLARSSESRRTAPE